MEMYKGIGSKIRVISHKAWDGERMLNEAVLSKKAYDKLMQVVGEDIVRANYDQEPPDVKGRLYGEFATYGDAPEFAAIEAVCDTADEGRDFLCNIIYGRTAGSEPVAYVLDVYYTRDPMSVTEGELVRRLIEFGVEQVSFESNFGGKAFAKVIQRQYEDAVGGLGCCKFKVFNQTLNKEARIIALSTTVTRKVFMPAGWETMWPKFYEAVTEYQRAGGNVNDDGPDTLTMVAQRLKRQVGFFKI
jgi:predicted phage terminase large subunit-like protein